MKDYTHIIKWRIHLKNSAPLHIGSGKEELLIDQLSNQPYIPATSFAGSMKAFLVDIGKEAMAQKYLGSEEGKSEIQLYDIFIEDYQLEKRSGIQINNEWGSAKKQALFNTQFVATGQNFVLKLQAKVTQEGIEEAFTVVNTFLNGIQEGSMRLGAKKTSGAGILQVQKATYELFDLRNKEQLKAYLSKDKEGYQQEINLVDLERAKGGIVFELMAYTKTPLLIKRGVWEGNNVQQAIKTPTNEYFIPGTSIKGALRMQTQKISKLFNQEELVEDLFGNRSTAKDQSIGRLYLQDAKIEEAKIVEYNKTQIDKVTGGVMGMKGSLAKEEAIVGKISLRFSYKVKALTKEEQAKIALITFALRDLGTGDLKLGSGQTIGRGQLQGNKLIIKGLPGEKTIVLEGERLNKGENIQILNQYAKFLHQGFKGESAND